jgi:hypothetical protein
MDEERFKRTLAIIERVLVPLILGVLVFTTQNAQVRISRAQTVLSQQQTAAAAEQTRLAVWSEKGKELRVLYPKLLEAGGGTRPLRDGGYYHLFDSLHLLCAPFTREPTRRVSDYLVQMAQHARFMRNNWTRLEREYSASFLLSLRLAKLELDYPPTSDESLAVAVRKFRDYLAPNESVIGLTNP